MSEKKYRNDLSVLGQVWQPRKLAYTPRESNLLSHLLAQRSILEQDKADFLSPTLRHFLPNPITLNDMAAGVDAAIKAIHEGKKILVFGDYDVDGATSSALMLRFFRQLGVEIEFYIPDRDKEGYGPNSEALRQIHEQGTDLVITVDCGAVAYEPLAYAKKIGLDVIVIDHHAGGDVNPECVAHINPNRKDENSDLTYLAAVGVSFLFCVEVVKSLKNTTYFRDKGEPNLISLLDIVALGTVCDVVPLVGLNRAFVSQGLKVMSQTQNTGLKSLFQILELDALGVNAYHLGFVIGPRINAGGRIGSSRLGTLLLSSDSKSEVEKAATELNLLNEERRQIQDVTFADADSKVDKESQAIVVSSEEWHHGVIGIVAGKLKEKYHKPTFVIALDPDKKDGKASARSISGFDIGASIHAAKKAGVILQGGGHPMAGGFSLTVHQIPDFIGFMNQYISGHLDMSDRQAKRIFDEVLSLNSVTNDLVDTIEQLSPFGAANPTPKFVFQDVRLSKVVVLKEKHIKCFFKDDVSSKSAEGIIFNAFESDIGAFLLKHQGKHIDVFAGVKRDVWMGRAKLTLHIEDVRECD